MAPSPPPFAYSPAGSILIHVNDPPPVTAQPPPLASTSTAAATKPDSAQQKARRAFKGKRNAISPSFCARSFQGDLNNPHDPPCTRCRREGVTCEFLPSRRGGRVPYTNQRKNREQSSPPRPAQERERRQSVTSRGDRDVKDEQDEREDSPYEDDEPEDQPQVLASSAMGHIASLSAMDDGRPHDFSVVPNFPPSNEIGRAALRYPPTTLPPPISASDIFRHPRAPSNPSNGDSPRVGSDASPAETASDGKGSITSSTQLKKKRRLSGGPVDAETLAAASLRNPVDALDLLVLAADRGVMESEGEKGDQGENKNGDQLKERNGEGEMREASNGKKRKVGERSPAPKSTEPKAPTLADFPLVKKGVVTTKKLCELVDVFFSRCHFIFPIIPYQRVPRTEEQLAKFAHEELHLTTVMCVISSRHDKNPRVHDKSWAYLQTLINDIILGKNVGVGAVEALLLLSEYLPRQQDVAASKLNAEENRMSWMLVGTAVRLGYMLGLDQKTMMPAKPLSETTSGEDSTEVNNRERVAWTCESCAPNGEYCARLTTFIRRKTAISLTDSRHHPVPYLLELAADLLAFIEYPSELEKPFGLEVRLLESDSGVSHRSSLCFDFIGPGLCFTGGAGGVHPTAAKNFPSLRFIPDVQDDFASLLQAYVELTQMMTASSDILFPSRERTASLIRLGEYYKYIDEFQRSLELFRMTWEGKRWATYPLTECIWITFHYLRLYIYAFAFQAHIHRATMSDGSDDGHHPSSNLFPAGLVASPDAKFILEAIDAAADLLRLVTDRLHPGGALPFLPWRFFMMISYGAVFLLKAVYVGAVTPSDRTVIIRLLKRLIFVLACASTDEQHPGVRYARLLNGLLRAFSSGQDSLAATRAQTPARRTSPAPETAPHPMDFMAAYVAGNASTVVSPGPAKDPYNASGVPGHDDFVQNFGATFHPSFINPTTGSTSQFPPVSTPFPMLPFAESQPFQQLANSLDAIPLDFDFGFEDPDLPAPPPAEAFSNFLLEDSALDFWQSFENQEGTVDWSQLGATTMS
ncbi:hypothetical protein P7C70_g3474, partial [Phenoliferia sp. Uapishka_3]